MGVASRHSQCDYAPRALLTIRYLRRWYADSSRDVNAIPTAVWQSLTPEQQSIMRFPSGIARLPGLTAWRPQDFIACSGSLRLASPKEEPAKCAANRSMQHLKNAYACLPANGLLVLADRYINDDGTRPLDRSSADSWLPAQSAGPIIRRQTCRTNVSTPAGGVARILQCRDS